VLATTAVLALTVFVPALALAGPVSCGDVITEDTTLDSDLDCGDLSADESALVIGADGVTLDLGGHSVSGPAAGIGIDNIDGHDDVRIVNGTVRGFDDGVFLAAGHFGEFYPFGADRNELSGLTLRDNNYNGILAYYSEALLVANNTFHNNDFGVEFLGVEDSRIAANVLSNDDDPDFRRDSAQSAISLFVSDRNEVVGNAASIDVFGITVNGSRNKLVGNTVRLSEFWGIEVSGADHTLLRNNVANDNVDRPGGQEGGPGDGIFIRQDTTATRLIHNRADRNGDDGIEIRSPDTTLLANRASLNGDFGIEAVPGVHDAGNRASGNGNPLQCLNVVCH
jgi:parallel beta-helix repeat protein